VALEPTEALRVLKDYGNPQTKVICNMRPVQSIGVICGEQTYPAREEIEQWLTELSASAWLIDTTEAAIKLGNPILSNIIAVGALAGSGALPLRREDFEVIFSKKISPDKLEVNLKAFDLGLASVKK
jgi:indolepyruvate ferredoxin oxidoreductase beta subunit